MDPFKIFPGTNADLLACEVNQLIGAALGRQVENENYFDQFNANVNRLNHLLNHPPSAEELHKKAYLLQEEYNQELLLGQERWTKSEADFSVGKQVLKNLAQKKREYNKALEPNKYFELRKSHIDEYLSGQGWDLLLVQAKKVGCLKEVKKLQSDWSAQKQLAHCDCEDLVLILTELKDFQWFLKLITPVFVQNSQILSILNDNYNLLKKLNKQLTVAIAWRLHAASLCKNLWFDDHVWALNYSLGQLLGREYVRDYQITSQKLTPSIVKVFIKHLQKAQHKIDRDKWFESRWICDPDDQYPIKVTLTEDLEILPTALIDLIPKSRNELSEIFPDHFIRYFYFRGATPKNRLEKCLKKSLIKEPYELIAFLNEATYQVNVLQETLSAQNNFVLCEMVQTPGFKSALLFPEIIMQERNRISKFQYHSWVMWSINWFQKKLLGNKTQDFFLQWTEILSSIEQNIIAKSKHIVSKLILSLDRNLLQEIKDNIFNCPKSLLTDLFEFVQHYGSHKEKVRFQEITSPVYLFKQFQFFTRLESDLDVPHQINKEAIFVFVRYAKLYWTPPECEAAQAVAGILTGDFPKNEEEDEKLLIIIASWFKGNALSVQTQVFDFLNMLGLDFVVKIGARSNVLAYRFLSKYAIEGFKIWEKEREKDLSQKYFLLIGALAKPLGSELDVQAQRDQKIDIAFIDDLKRDQSRSNYIAALGEALKEYLKLYDGSNGHYAQFVLHLCDQANLKNEFDYHLRQYFITRLCYLVKNPECSELTDEELSSYHKLRSDPTIHQVLTQVVLGQDQAKSINLNIYSILSVLKNPELLGLYFFKKMSSLVQAGSLDILYHERDHFDKNKNNIIFMAKINAFFMEYLKTQYTQVSELDPKLHWVIESYGDQIIKEEARYIMVKQFLFCDRKRPFNVFLSELKDYIEGDQLTEVFILEDSKKRLGILYRDYNTKMLEQQYWDGYAQYLMENMLYPQTQACIFGAKIAWLNALLFNLYPFSGDINKYLSESPIIDLHMKNVTVPNDQINLTTFFGPEFGQVKKIIVQYLAQFEMCPNDRKLKLITHYLDDELFRRDEHWNILNDKLLVYKKIHEIMHFLVKNEWQEAKNGLSLVQYQVKGCRFLLSNTTNKEEREQLEVKIQYYETMLVALQKTAGLYCKAQDLKNNGILELFQGPLVNKIFLSRSLTLAQH